MKLSIIIPAYNASLYIIECLNSIFNQSISFHEYEVIVVNDGSTDNTLDVLENISSQHDNLRIYNQRNQGPSAARNYGLRIAKGEYIWFVDSDDSIKPGSLQALLDNVKQNSIDILYFSRITLEVDGSIDYTKSNQQPVRKNVILTGEQTLAEGFYPSSSVVALWNRFYLKSNNLYFNTKIKYAEDVLFTLYAVAKAKKMMFWDEAYYVYHKREGSLTTTMGLEKQLIQKYSDIIVSKSIIELSQKFHKSNPHLSKLVNMKAQNILFGLTYTLFLNKLKCKKTVINRSVLTKMKQEKVYPLTGPFDSLKKTIFSKILNFEFLIK